MCCGLVGDLSFLFQFLHAGSRGAKLEERSMIEKLGVLGIVTRLLNDLSFGFSIDGMGRVVESELSTPLWVP